MRRWSMVVAALGVLAPLLVAPSASADTIAAKELLAKFRAADEKGSSTYDRDKFRHWIDADGDGCSTRTEVLLQESRVEVTKGDGCASTKGEWYSRYDARTWSDPADVDIDHHVAIKEAWESGARKWAAKHRKRFANDLGFRGTLNAMTDNLNSSKGADDPADWLPARAKCRYAFTWVQVKYRWRLKMNPAEKTALREILTGKCGDREIQLPKRAITKTQAAGTATNPSAAPVSEYDCPDSHPIKGNADSMIYHVPGGNYYDETKPEECFATTPDAEEAGYRASKGG